MAVFSIVYSRSADRLPMAFSALASSGAFLLSLYVLQRAAISFGLAWIMGFLAISVGVILAPNKVQSFKSAILDGTCRPAFSRQQRWS